MTFWIYVSLLFQNTHHSVTSMFSFLYEAQRGGWCRATGLWFYKAKDYQVLSPRGHQYDQEMAHSGPVRVRDSQRRRNTIWSLGEGETEGKDWQEREKKKLKCAHG